MDSKHISRLYDREDELLEVINRPELQLNEARNELAEVQDDIEEYGGLV